MCRLKFDLFFQVHDVVHNDLIRHEEVPDGKVEILNTGTIQEMQQRDLHHFMSTTEESDK